MKDLKKTVEKILEEEKTTKSEMVITNEGVQKCTHCKGEGYCTDKNGKKTKCSYCDGAGYTYNKPVKAYTGRKVIAMAEVKKVKAKKTQTKKASAKKVVEIREAKPLNFQDMKFKTFNHDGINYLLSNTVLIKENLVNAEIKSTKVEDCTDKLLQVYFKALKVKTFKELIDEKKGVLGVRYAVRKELPMINLSGKVLDTVDYVQSALKLSKEVWIDIRYGEIFKNHRFIYLNPIKGKMIPVLCINKNTRKLDGIIMPLALK